MKVNRVILFGIVVLLVGLTAWLLIPRRSTEAQKTSFQQEVKKADAVKPATSKDKESIEVQEDDASSPSESFEEKVKKTNQEFSLQIIFYGKVVDEKGNPVTGATAFFSVNDLSRDGSKYESKSDDQGLFSLTNIKGGGMSVRVFKDGYYTSPNEYRYFHYNSFGEKHIPNRNDPIVFRLHKKGESAELVHREKLFTFSIDGAVHYVDLLAGKKYLKGSPQGDFSVSAVRTKKSLNDRYDWEVVLEVVGDGGFIESNEEFMLQAPESGYQSTVRIGYRASDPNWQSQEKHKFYLRSRDVLP